MLEMIGKTLGHYRVVQQLGRGGMGEVYVADDLFFLDRKVALKFLPDTFAADPERMARFEREAKLLASLNHPNIAAIYGLEQAEGKRFIVMELVEGESLAQRLNKGPLPIDEALGVCRQIAEGLEAAHEKGVIHRDLKPANVMITAGDKVKILDFGLAKALVDDTQSIDSSQSPTITEAMIQPGVILGTAAYMSPEQAKGKTVDKRADIWAFGCILYECLIGKRVFEGETVTETLASVLTMEPDWEKVPARVRPLLRRCLEKDPKKRLRDVGDAMPLLEEAPVSVQVPARRRVLFWVAAAVVLTAIIAGVAVWNPKPAPPPEPRPVTRFYYELPKDQQFADTMERSFAVSPDGRQFVYSTGNGLYLRSMDELDARLIPGTGGARTPFFSPDGQWIGFVSALDGQLKKISISGGAPLTLTNAAVATGSIFWGADDTIVYSQVGSGIMRVSANGGTPEVIVNKKEQRETLRHPQILPDKKSVLFTVGPSPYKIVVQSLQSGERKELFSGDTAQYLPTGHIAYALGNNLLAVPFDLKTMKVTGGPVSVIEGVLQRGGALQYAVANSGILVYVPGALGTSQGPQRTLVWVDRNGKEEPIATPPGGYRTPKISPDGTRVALAVGTLDTGGGKDIWIWDLVRKTLPRLTFDSDLDDYPLRTRDGRRIGFRARRQADWEVRWKAADGTGKEDPLISPSSIPIIPFSWSRDGKTLVAQEFNGIAGSYFHYDVVALSLEDERKWKPLLKEKYTEVQPEISPDGRWMAYTSDESGKNEVYVRPFPDVDKGRWQVSTAGGDSPLWSRDERELFYLCGDAVMAVSVTPDPAFSPEGPRVLFRGTYVSAGFSILPPELRPWDISPDGKRFLMMKEVSPNASAGEGPRRINIVLNWTEELKQRVPVK